MQIVKELSLSLAYPFINIESILSNYIYVVIFRNTFWITTIMIYEKLKQNHYLISFILSRFSVVLLLNVSLKEKCFPF